MFLFLRFFIFFSIILNILSCKTRSQASRNEQPTSVVSPESVNPKLGLINLESLAQNSLKAYTESIYASPFKTTHAHGDLSWEHYKLSSQKNYVLRKYLGKTPERENSYQIIQLDGKGNFIGKPSKKEFEKTIKDNDIDFDDRKEVEKLFWSKLDDENYGALEKLSDGEMDVISFDSHGNFLESLEDVGGFNPNNMQGIIMFRKGLEPAQLIEKMKRARPDASIELMLLHSGTPGCCEAIVLKSENTFNLNIQAKELENENVLKSAVNEITPESKALRYGGQPGRNYFKLRYETVIEPALVGTLKEIKAGNKDVDIAAFNSLLYELGQQRKNIAEKVSVGLDSKGMGSIYNETQTMRDPINERSFPNWYHSFTNKFAEILGTNTHVNPTMLSEIGTKIQSIFKGTKVADEGEIILPEMGNVRVLKISSSEATGNFGNLRVAIPTSKKNLVATDLFFSMEHIPHSKDTIPDLAPYFYKALNAGSKSELEENLAYLLLRMSHQSVYGRGQAAITNWLLKGIAKAHNYELKFSNTWEGPTAINPDMRALSTFDDAQFLREFRGGVKLEPIAH